MSEIIKRMFVLTDSSANNNKFWEITVDSGGVVTTRNGRVGSAGQSRILGSGEALLKSKIEEKVKKGYREIEVIGETIAAREVKSEEVASAAELQIARGSPVVAELVRQLAKINRHQILEASGGQMDLDLSTGIISTPVGVVTLANITAARNLLEGFEKFVAAKDFDNQGFVKPLEDYLMLVPQKVGSRRGWHNHVMPDLEALTRQFALLDQLESSIGIAEERVKNAKKSTGKAEAPRAIFDVQMSISNDPDLRRRVEEFYNRSRQRMHASYDFKVARIFDVQLGDMSRQYQEDGGKLGGVMELWHGTRAHNLLSILKSGLIVPKANGSIHVTGRMFGNGLYFSDQSTKSLNYAYGYWDGQSRDNRCFMFLADVAMGKFHHPKKTGTDVRPPAGYDSVFARGGIDIVRNNEMIVYRTSQANLKYLVEFEK